MEEFLKKNKIQYTDSGISQAPEGSEGSGGEAETGAPKCIFCSIIKGEMPSYKIAEIKKALAILEINPLSKGHLIVLPKEHAGIEKMPKSALGLAQKLAKKIKKKLKPLDIKIETSSFQGHSMINIIPMYKDIPLKKIKAEEKDLKIVQSKLETKKRASRKKEPKQESEKTKKPEDLSKLPKISFRIP